MTVRELISELMAMDQEALVVVQKDSEGNSYSPAVGAEETWYSHTTTWYGETWDSETEAAASGEGPAVRAVVIWPVN